MTVGKGALIVGGGPAATQAALDLAASGIRVTLVEPSPFVAGPDDRWNRTQALELAKHPNVTLMTNSVVAALHGRKGSFEIQLDCRPRFVDLAKCTACGDCVEVCPVTIPENGGSRRAIFGGGDGAVPDVYAIEKRGVAPCKATCPGDIHVQGYVALIAEGRFQEALALIRKSVPLPGVLGRVCYHPCEDACRRGTEIDEPVSICALKRFVADHEVEQLGGPQVETVPVDPSFGKVAIVGAGPAGLTVAARLAQDGVACEIFEALPVAGGMLAVGIPEYRLPKDVLQREVAAIEALGVPIHLNHFVDDAEWASLRANYDATFVGVGAHRPRQLQIPGDDLAGVQPGVEFLHQVNLAGINGGERPTVGEHVVVIGGGNTAIDAALAAKRLGAKTVTILYRRSRPEMLANPWEINEAEDENVQFHFLAAPIRALGEDGEITALECIRNQLGEPDQSGRRRPVPIENSEFRLPCDTLLPAIGQTVACAFEGLEIGRAGSIQVDPVTLQTNLADVFAGGDAVIGPASVIESIGDGRRAAQSILRYLRGQELAEGRTADRPDTSHVPYYTPDQPILRARVQMPHLPPEQRRTFAETALGLTEEQAIAEAQRCLACGVCSECLACVDACQPGAIQHLQRMRTTELRAGVVIWSDTAGPAPPVVRGNIYELYGHDPQVGSAVAAQAMADLALYRRKRPLPRWVPHCAEPRIGVFVCQCGEQIGGVLDVPHLVAAAQGLPNVILARDIPFACQPGGAETIKETMAEHNLNQVVLAACSCCSLDQVCESCTYQRVRCKRNLLSVPFDLINLPAEFINIREQCAWAHREDPDLGTAKAERMIAAAVAKVGLLHPALRAPRQAADLDARVVVAGGSDAADTCARLLRAQQFVVTRMPELPLAIEGSLGRFRVTQNGADLQASAIVLAPSQEQELDRFVPRNGLFLCQSGEDIEIVGAATAAHVGALLGSGRVIASPNVAVIDADRCRGCGTCQDVCQHLAIQLVERGGRLVSQVDPLLCQGCGTCIGGCPSSAISGGYSTDQQIEAMLVAMLA